jgi:hypothetical protein
VLVGIALSVLIAELGAWPVVVNVANVLLAMAFAAVVAAFLDSIRHERRLEWIPSTRFDMNRWLSGSSVRSAMH